jgi:tetratricopeptide (TPR) repeat protein
MTDVQRGGAKSVRGGSGASGPPDSRPDPARRADHASRARRRRLLLWSALPALLVLCLAAKLLSLDPLAGHATRAFDAKDAAAVGMAAAALQAANIVEPHKAPFAAGDAQALAGNFAAARLRFEEALELVPAAPAGSPDACIIRLNLVLAIERLGDDKLRLADAASAAALFTEALEVARAAPDGCFSGGPAAEAGGKLNEAAGRLNGKLGAATGSAGEQAGAAEESAPSEPEADSPDLSQLEQLEESARESQRERNTGRERADYLEDSRADPGPDRPW